MALLRERERIICAGETLALVRQRARKQKNFSFGFGTKKRKRSAEIAERFRRWPFGSFRHEAITRGAGRRFALRPLGSRFAATDFRDSGKNRKSEGRFRLVDGLDGSIQGIQAEDGAESRGDSAQKPARNCF